MYVKITVDTDNVGLIKELKEIEQNTEELVAQTIKFWNSYGILPDMDLSTRTRNCLFRAHCTTLPEIIKLVSSGKALKLRNFGKRSLNELLTVLKEKYDTDLFYVYNCENYSK